NGLIGVQGNGIHNQFGNGNLMTAHAEGNADGQNANQIRTKRQESNSKLKSMIFVVMAVAADLDEIKEVNANCILMANLQQASSSGTQADSTPVYDSDGSAEVHENYDNNEIFNMFTQEEQYTELLEPIPEPQQVPQTDNNVISEDKEKGCCLSSDTTIDCSEGRGRNPTSSRRKVNANCILMANLQQASSSGTQTDSAPVYDTDGSAEVHENYDNNEIFNMFTQEEQYTELLEPIPEPQQVPQNDNNVIS
nr:ribonuclease H-like domain-containing protein [Tanacetum cinerariifolium]